MRGVKGAPSLLFYRVRIRCHEIPKAAIWDGDGMDACVNASVSVGCFAGDTTVEREL